MDGSGAEDAETGELVAQRGDGNAETRLLAQAAICTLPNEVLHSIVAFLPHAAVSSLRRTCRALRSAVPRIVYIQLPVHMAVQRWPTQRTYARRASWIENTPIGYKWSLAQYMAWYSGEDDVYVRDDVTGGERLVDDVSNDEPYEVEKWSGEDMKKLYQSEEWRYRHRSIFSPVRECEHATHLHLSLRYSTHTFYRVRSFVTRTSHFGLAAEHCEQRDREQFAECVQFLEHLEKKFTIVVLELYLFLDSHPVISVLARLPPRARKVRSLPLWCCIPTQLLLVLGSVTSLSLHLYSRDVAACLACSVALRRSVERLSIFIIPICQLDGDEEPEVRALPPLPSLRMLSIEGEHHFAGRMLLPQLILAAPDLFAVHCATQMMNIPPDVALRSSSVSVLTLHTHMLTFDVLSNIFAYFPALRSLVYEEELIYGDCECFGGTRCTSLCSLSLPRLRSWPMARAIIRAAPNLQSLAIPSISISHRQRQWILANLPVLLSVEAGHCEEEDSPLSASSEEEDMLEEASLEEESVEEDSVE